MPKSKYHLSHQALDDLKRIYSYGKNKFGELQAEKYVSNLFLCFDRIRISPFSFESVDHIFPGYRRCVCGVDSIYFRIDNNQIQITTIIGRQEIKSI
ncbi:MAG: type II toxin-antitoxin system RelE/ParE family toxin [Crocinitomicaceae bacterium]|nr:type II toxin-antitoxin system RelE/ParE family toxin [Crocinitomicaceae bacterium]